jgi:hypothetical protein
LTGPVAEATDQPITLIVDWAAGIGNAEPAARRPLLSRLAR